MGAPQLFAAHGAGFRQHRRVERRARTPGASGNVSGGDGGGGVGPGSPISSGGNAATRQKEPVGSPVHGGGGGMVLGGHGMPIHEYGYESDAEQTQQSQQSQRAKWVQKQREWRDRGKQQSPELTEQQSMVQGWGDSSPPGSQRALLNEMGRATPHTDGKGGFPQRQVHSPRRTFQSAQFASTK